MPQACKWYLLSLLSRQSDNAYDLARQMDGAREVRCSKFAEAVAANLKKMRAIDPTHGFLKGLPYFPPPITPVHCISNCSPGAVFSASQPSGPQFSTG